jgi:hypothetical protein
VTRRRGSAAPIVAAVLLVAVAGCAPRRVALPTGTGEPLDAASAGAIADEAFTGCAAVRTLVAELGLSGRAGPQRLRGRLIAGLAAPASVRLEGVAPFGPPVFILAASPGRSILLLPRDDRVLEGAEPAAILQALAGVWLGPDELRAVLAGCPPGSATVAHGTRHGDLWTVLRLTDGAQAYVRRVGTAWQAWATVSHAMTIEYAEFADGRPTLVRLVSQHQGPAAFDLRVRLSQVELNTEVPAAAFEVNVPPEARPLTLDELREAGPMRDADRDTAAR